MTPQLQNEHNKSYLHASVKNIANHLMIYGATYSGVFLLNHAFHKSQKEDFTAEVLEYFWACVT